MRTLAIALASLAALVGLGSLAPMAASAAPGSAAQPAARVVDIVEVRGLVDDIVVDYVSAAIDRAERDRVEALVLQVDSPGGVADPDSIERLIARIEGASVPVAAWVGGTGRPRAFGAAYEMVQASDVWGFGPKAVVGPDRSGSMGEAAAKERGLVDVDVNAPTLGDFIVELDGRQLAGRTVDTADVVQRDGQPRREPNVRVRFSKPGLTARLLHAVTNPGLAYVLLMVALLLFVFELYTAGVGVAGVTGVLAMIPAAHGLAALPTRPSSLALIGLGVLGYTIDLQAGSPRTWTVIGTVALAVGSVRLYDGFAVPLPVLALALAGTALAMVAGMPAMLRTRFATPTIGRESMIGRDGVALGSVDPEGTVEVDGAPWPARTNRATPIGPGDPVRVVAIDGLLLEVEPETGAARDYRR